MKFTRAQRRWIRDAFQDTVMLYIIREDEIPKMHRTFAAMLRRRRRAHWRTK